MKFIFITTMFQTFLLQFSISLNYLGDYIFNEDDYILKEETNTNIYTNEDSNYFYKIEIENNNDSMEIPYYFDYNGLFTEKKNDNDYLNLASKLYSQNLYLDKACYLNNGLADECIKVNWDGVSKNFDSNLNDFNTSFDKYLDNMTSQKESVKDIFNKVFDQKNWSETTKKLKKFLDGVINE